MKKILTLLAFLASSLCSMAQGWPSAYEGVMLQGFYWDGYSDSSWKTLEAQASDLAPYFKLIWIPQSAYCGGTSMGYDDFYWFTNYNSSFGTEAELRSLISTMKSKDVGMIADVVINHRKNVSSWVDFPAETYKGVTYQLQATDICADDDGGDTKAWADANGVSLSANKDTGEDWSGMRDLDHNSQNVQKNVLAYLDMLLNDLGYTGFRYDMVKGYSGSFTGKYNSTAKPEFSVGEYWDGNVATVKKWLDATKVSGSIQSAAFDFPFRYTLRDAANNSDWSKLSTGGIATDKSYQRYAVTFAENHDTEYRSSTSQQDPIRKDTLAVNAFMLAMPGTPCVFLKHWIDCKHDIKNMILLRNFCGINNESTYSNYVTGQKTHFAVQVEGSKAKLLAVVGSGANTYTPTSRWILAANGYHWAYYLDKNTETAWIDLPSGSYDKPQTATLRAISATSGAKVVYTLDGSTPTAQGTCVNSGTAISIPYGETTLKAALLIGGTVSGIVERNYSIKEFSPYDITVYVNVDNVGWSSVNFWTWGGDGSHSPANSSWPGDKKTSTTTIGGKTWYAANYRINSSSDYVNFVFSTGTGSPQTVDVNQVTETSYFEVSTDKQDSKYLVDDVTSQMTGIKGVKTDSDNNVSPVYSIDGRMIGTVDSPDDMSSFAKGLYIVGGKKIVVR